MTVMRSLTGVIRPMTNVYQVGLAVALAVVVGIGAVVYLKKRAVADMSERQKANRAAVRRGFRAFNGVTRVYRDVSEVDAAELAGMARGESAGSPGVRSALYQLVHAARAARRETKSLRVPALARRVGIEGVLLLVVGTVATTSVAVIRSWVTVDGGPGDVVTALTDFAVTFGDVVGAVLAAYPLTNILAALGITGITVSLSVIYDAWLAWGVLLVLGAVVLTVLDRRVSRRRPSAGDALPQVTPRGAALRALGVLAASIAAGVFPVYAGRELGHAGAGSVLGAALSAIILLGGVVHATHRGVARIRRVLQLVGRVDAVRYVVRRVWAVFAVLGAPVLLGLAYRAVETGRLTGVVGVLAGSGPVSVALVVAVVAVLVWMHAPRDLSSLSDLRDAVSASLSKAVIRSWMKAKGLPYLGVAAASAVLIGVFQLPTLWGVLGGVLVGAAARGAYIVFKRVEYRNRLSDRGARDLPRAVVAVGRIEDSEGNALYAARIHGRKLLHRDAERLARDASKVARDLLSDRGVRPTESEWAAERAYMDGHTSPEKWRKSLLAATRSDVKDVVSPAADPGDATEILLDERPRRYVASVLESLEKKGVLERRPDKWELLRE